MRTVLAMLLAVAALSGCDGPRPAPARLDIGQLLGAAPSEGFARADRLRAFDFPQDHGAHPAFRNEWWYLTGNLEDPDGRRFGYQVTFFRNALQPPGPPGGDSAWRSRSLWMAHAALTDAQGRVHRAHERFSRGEPGLAGATAQPFAVWLENWRLSGLAAGGAHAFPWRLSLPTADFSLQLSLRADAEPVLQGERGWSRKSARPGNASYYYSFPRLQSSGELALAGQRYRVAGLSWFDREWSTSALDQGQTGWDWFSLQLRDGSALMYYQLRRGDREVDPFSRGSRVSPAGVVSAIGPDDIELRPLAHWRGPDGVDYPVEWALALRPDGPRWLVRAVLPQQFMDLSVRYWEGAVDVLDAASGRPLGRGYLEMTRLRR
jgi:predicted secreted hydrolase